LLILLHDTIPLFLLDRHVNIHETINGKIPRRTKVLGKKIIRITGIARESPITTLEKLDVGLVLFLFHIVSTSRHKERLRELPTTLSVEIDLESGSGLSTNLPTILSLIGKSTIGLGIKPSVNLESIRNTSNLSHVTGIVVLLFLIKERCAL